jgi:hypothetical protein
LRAVRADRGDCHDSCWWDGGSTFKCQVRRNSIETWRLEVEVTASSLDVEGVADLSSRCKEVVSA